MRHPSVPFNLKPNACFPFSVKPHTVCAVTIEVLRRLSAKQAVLPANKHASSSATLQLALWVTSLRIHFAALARRPQESLLEHLRANPHGLPEREALIVVRSVASAIHAMHSMNPPVSATVGSHASAEARETRATGCAHFPALCSRGTHGCLSEEPRRIEQLA